MSSPQDNRHSPPQRHTRSRAVLPLVPAASLAMAGCGQSGTATRTTNSSALAARSQRPPASTPSHPLAGSTSSHPSARSTSGPAGIGSTRYLHSAASRGSALRSSRPAKETPAARQRLLAYAACMRRKGISMPAPNFSGRGPVFDPKKIGATSPGFARALTACRPELAAGGATG